MLIDLVAMTLQISLWLGLVFVVLGFLLSFSRRLKNIERTTVALSEAEGVEIPKDAGNNLVKQVVVGYAVTLAIISGLMFVVATGSVGDTSSSSVKTELPLQAP